ncbi:MAG: hypothetical protein HZT43_05705 [Exiguobacterium profundum]|nr:MAG: hypothetical protein HZT43_05705 [Exiguobacterium profundum]
MYGGDGNDYISSNQDADELYGGNGNDYLVLDRSSLTVGLTLQITYGGRLPCQMVPLAAGSRRSGSIQAAATTARISRRPLRATGFWRARGTTPQRSIILL